MRQTNLLIVNLVAMALAFWPGWQPTLAQKQAVHAITARDQAEVQEGINAADNAKKNALKSGRSSFSYEKHRFSLVVPEGLNLQVLDHRGTRSFNFLGKERGDKSRLVLGILIMLPDSNGALPTASDMTEGMLHPYKQRWTDYQQKATKLVIAGGKEVAAVEYSGAYGGQVKARGIVAVHAVKGALFIITGTDREEYFADSMKVIRKLVASLEISSRS